MFGPPSPLIFILRCFYGCIQVRARRPAQLLLRRTSGWGGAREGAGRKPIAGRRRPTPHQARPRHRAGHPVHVTLRVRPDVPSLRGPETFPAVRTALAAASRSDYRLVQFSVQADHLHLLVEGADTRTLALGIRGLIIRVARAINRALGRTGTVWNDRYHARALTTPREVRHGLGLRADELSQARAAPAVGAGPLLVGALVRRVSRRREDSAASHGAGRPARRCVPDVAGHRRVAPPRVDRDLRAAGGRGVAAPHEQGDRGEQPEGETRRALPAGGQGATAAAHVLTRSTRRATAVPAASGGAAARGTAARRATARRAPAAAAPGRAAAAPGRAAAAAAPIRTTAAAGRATRSGRAARRPAAAAAGPAGRARAPRSHPCRCRPTRRSHPPRAHPPSRRRLPLPGAGR